MSGAHADDWRSDALCAQTSPDLFFDNRKESIEAAKRICGACPVQVDCEAALVPESEDEGVVAGLTAEERLDHPAYKRAPRLEKFLPPALTGEEGSDV